ncbi:DUF7410 domain-containing protein [Halobacterium wangiae]|uniref:DUF7410 domain-containing protein n=1 Tax=Halobacterium wangiae TaxID=2902623 RepID=UPI001E5A3630|nr:DNA-binding protein [Halobacterium wangiae]
MQSATGADRRDPVVDVESDVGAEDSVAAACPHCGRPFAETAARDLHVGEVHPEECSTAERTAYEAAREAEREELFYFHLRVVVALGVLYALTVLLYMVVLGSDIL